MQTSSTISHSIVVRENFTENNLGQERRGKLHIMVHDCSSSTQILRQDHKFDAEVGYIVRL